MSKLGKKLWQGSTNNMVKKLLLPLWIIAAILLFLYSYTQVDLSLTLSSGSIFQTIQKAFQYVGWFNRPLSTYIYAGIGLYVFLLYFATIRLAFQKEISIKLVATITAAITLILTLSYNAFSYDIFNYIFDAKIVIFYNQNPYLHKALDFPTDPMLSFMRWTHRVYPYGPIWLLLTIPLSYIGLNIFFLTFFIFKLFMSGFYLLSVWAIYKIAKSLKLSNPLVAVVLFALNPLVIIESLVSSHNDIVMMGLALLGTLLVFEGKRMVGIFAYIFSIGTKFATGISFIALGLLFFKKRQLVIPATLVLMIGAVFLATARTNFQPWYLLYVLPYAALVASRYSIISIIIVSIAGFAYYIPFLYTGNWDPPIPDILNGIMIMSIVITLISCAILYVLPKKR